MNLLFSFLMKRNFPSYGSIFIGILFLTTVLSGCGIDKLPSTTNTENITEDSTNLSGKVRLSATVSIASGKPSSEIANATVYVIGQESQKVTTNSNGEFTLLVDAKQSGVVLQKSRALPRRDSTPPSRNQYGIIVASNTREHGKKFEVTGNDGDDITLPSPVEITEVGSISGKVTLQNKTDNTGIMVYIPGTSFMALTDASGSFTISGVPEGTYLILRAEKDGYNYSALSNITVQSSKTTTIANQMLLISTGAKGSILINNGASITTSRTVNINISATDNAVLMTIAEEPTFQNVSWATIQSYTTHIFTSDGDKTLYIKFADANGLESTTYSDSITIDTNPHVTLSSPSGTISLTKPTLTWIASTLPNPKYHVQVSADSTFSSILEEATNLTSTSYTLTNTLSNAVTYYYRVSIIDENGTEWNWSDTGQFTIDLSTVTLTSPSNSSVTNDTTPTFSWSANSNAVSYNLVLSTNSDLTSPTVNKTGIATTTFTDTDTSALTNTEGTIYYWAVTLVDANGASGTRSSIYSFTLDTTAPSSSSISINSGASSTTSSSVTLTLSATDTVGVTGYYASENSTQPSIDTSGWTSVTSTTSYSANVSFTLSSSSDIKTVYVWFRDGAGNVSLAVSDNITPIPSVPSGLTPVSTGEGQVTISWDSVLYATSYNIYWSTSTGVIKTTGTQITGATSPYNHTGLTNGTTYYYVVTAVNSYGESSESSQVSATPPISLPKTGQTTSYSTDDDGELQKGAAWPSPRLTVGTGAEANCITDNLTGLMWVQSPDSTTRTWTDALTYANNLSLCGYSDWRLPNINELESLVHAEQSNPASWLNSQGFSNVQASFYWSSTASTADAYFTGYAWSVSMSDGYVKSDFYKTGSFYVLPVRAGSSGTIQLPETGQTTCYDSSVNVISCTNTGQDGDIKAGVTLPSTRFTVGTGAEADCITDNLTGLMWVQSPDSTERTWVNALTYANDLTLCGYTDWRLPNRKELRSLINYGQFNSATWLNTQGFSNVQAFNYWSSTTYAFNMGNAWYVNMIHGDVSDGYKTYDVLYVLPVRAGQ